MATPKSDSTTKVTQHSLPASIKPSNPEAFPTVYADNAWDVIDENSDSAALLGAPGQYTQHDINGEALSRYGRVFPTVAAMVAATGVPDGYVAYCTDPGLHYDYKASRTADPVLGKWRDTDGAVTYYEHEWNIMGATDPETRRRIMQTTSRIHITRLWASEPLTLTNIGTSDAKWGIYRYGDYTEPRDQRWEFSEDGGLTWSPLEEKYLTPMWLDTLAPGASVQIRAISSVPTLYTSATERFQIELEGNIQASGNVMSMLWHDYEDKFVISEPWALAFLFYQQTALHDITQLVLPAVTLSEGCYRSMFEGCYNITTSPVLPAAVVPASAYRKMFASCTHLALMGTIGALTAPGEGAMEEMFTSCGALAAASLYLQRVTGASALDSMFSDCDALASIDMSLLETVTGPLAMNMMLALCPELAAITVGWTTWPTTGNTETMPTTDWVTGVAADGTFTAGALFTTQDESHVPESWTAASSAE